MNPFVKWFEDAVAKPAVDKVVAEAKANEAANIAEIEGVMSTEGKTAEAAVSAFITSKIKSSDPLVEAAEAFALPELDSLLGNLVAQGTNDVPTLYNEGLALLEKFDASL